MLGLLALIWYSSGRRRSSLEALYEKAIGAEFVGTSKTNAAVQAIADDKSPEATRVLMALATRPDSRSLPDVRRKSIEALSSRKSAEVAENLARLLQPFESLEVRTSVAQALQQQPCSVEISSRILYYLERLEAGEWASEDVPTYPESIRHELKDELNKDREREASLLNSDLSRCERETNMALANVHGFGSIIPSKFGLKYVRKMKFSASCPLLAQSANRLLKLEERNEEMADALKSTLAELDCEKHMKN